jgi:malonyl CoA-acyl carrier protein transacylase
LDPALVDILLPGHGPSVNPALDTESHMKAYLFPGQGSQRTGMGEHLFDAFPDMTAAADAILGYSIKELCLQDPRKQLGQTQFTQPALFVVNALACRQRRKDTGERPDFVAGHSLGEYNALECAGAIHFEDGLRLVQKRGELMATAPRGAMAAIIGPTADKVAHILESNGLTTIDVANYNAPTQTIISGLEDDIRNAQGCFEREQAMYIPLNVSGAFHSRYMQAAAGEFARFLEGFRFSAPEFPVIANITGLPCDAGDVSRNLAGQLTHSVRWLDSMHYLLQQGVAEFIELGPGDVLTKLIRSIRSQPMPARVVTAAPQPTAARTGPRTDSRTAQQKVEDWNRACPIGTRVRAEGYDEALVTKSQAVVLFGHRAAVYMQGYNGYFALDEVEPLTHAANPA